MLKKEEIYHYNYVLNQLGKRILPQYFYSKNPTSMDLWQNQICRQSHVIAAHYLDKWLNRNEELNYNIQFCESIFKDLITGSFYDHSWVWVESITQEDAYLCDIARVSGHIGFVRAVRNHPDDYLQDEEVTNKRLDKIDYKKLLEEGEYYTGIKGSEILKDIDQRLENCRLIINPS